MMRLPKKILFSVNFTARALQDYDGSMKLRLNEQQGLNAKRSIAIHKPDD